MPGDISMNHRISKNPRSYLEFWNQINNYKIVNLVIGPEEGQEVVCTMDSVSVAQGIDHGQCTIPGCWPRVLNGAERPANLKVAQKQLWN